MQRAASANGEAAPQGEANEGGDAEGPLANQQQHEEIGAANGNAPLEGSANEGERRCSSANEDAEEQEVTNGSLELQLTNEERERKALANEDRRNKALTNEDKGHKTPTNEDAEHKSPIKDTATLATNKNTVAQTSTNQEAAPRAAANENSPHQPPANQATPPDNATNDITAPPASTNSARDAWDWSLEEAWLRAPDEEWWAEPEGWGAELGEDEGSEGSEEWRLRPDEAWAQEGLGKWPRPNEALSEARADQWRPSPDQAWSKLIIQPGLGLARPGFGSLCRILLAVPSSTPPSWGLLSPAANAGRWVTVRLGSAEGRWANLVDAILETMTSGELALLRPVGVTMATVAIRLGRFTPPPPFWETPPTQRWRSVTSGQARAAALLTAGMVSAAGMVYSRCIRAAILAGGPPPYSPDITAVKAELHAGLASVQLRLGLPAAAAANAGKALVLHPAHLEARYRRGVAQAAMMDLEAAMADLMAVLRVQPGHAGARRELRRVRGAARERDARLARRLGRLFA